MMIELIKETATVNLSLRDGVCPSLNNKECSVTQLNSSNFRQGEKGEGMKNDFKGKNSR